MMSIQVEFIPKIQVKNLFFSLVASMVLLSSCGTEPKEEAVETEEVTPPTRLDVVTLDMDFQAVDTIPSGWVTWRYQNRSPQPHFILIDDPLDSITVDEFREELLPPFGEGIKKMYEGKNEEAMEAFGKIPAWYAGTTWPGGVGLTSPGMTSETTLKLEPGFYIMECYVKMKDGMFHTNMGMYKTLIVSEEKSPLAEPTPDFTIDISSENGIVFESPEKAGTYTFQVNYIDQKKYEHFQGHDVNLVRIDDSGDLAAIETWMNWLNLDGLIDPVPEGFTFLGGVNDMPTGSTGYFNATLEPGKYALISEVPDASNRNLLKTFEIMP
ncbi:hypothetical protein [Algoriphagus halophilus]|uniref:Uncharacterized protein n=1 Tax=Algoriphagus halophilus TaxID=226505 RepID=A0A1N6DRT1_9BACT|nr:hypothetical protein [Algoriphagus halophilus]SIN73403.1 hypothetical protein SAMN05444394_1304 [Algoriphagus halophilus]